jgi:hypothetical protein
MNETNTTVPVLTKGIFPMQVASVDLPHAFDSPRTELAD